MKLTILLIIIDIVLSAAIGEEIGIQEPRPMIEGRSLEDYVNPADLEKGAEALFKIAADCPDRVPTRVIGSKGHLMTLEYILGSLAVYQDYYDISVQDFNASYSRVHDYNVSVPGLSLKNVSAFTFSPNVPETKAKIVPANEYGCKVSDYLPKVKGSVAIVKRGFCNFAAKSKVAKSLGAVATIIYNSEDQSLHGTLGELKNTSEYSPTFGMTKSEGDKLLDFVMKNPDAKAVVSLNGTIKRVPTQNIVAQTKGGDTNNIVMLGAHSDSVPAGPGINDNGSGSVTLLSLAKYLTNFEVKNAVRFAWFSAEEEGLLGSDYYSKTLSPEENSKIRLFLDYDMLASPNYAYQIYDSDDTSNPAGSSNIRDNFIAYFHEKNQNFTLIPFDGRSDYVGFIKNGIPGGGVATGAEGIKSGIQQEMFGGQEGVSYDVCYHKDCDNLENLNYDAWVFNSQLIAYTLGNYAASLDKFPKRSTSIDIARVADHFNHHGDRLVM